MSNSGIQLISLPLEEDFFQKISGGSRILGMLSFEHVEKKHTWEPAEIAFACQLADQIALKLLDNKRRQTVDELQKSEEKFRQLVENMNDVFFMRNKDGIIEYISPSARQLFDFDLSTIV